MSKVNRDVLLLVNTNGVFRFYLAFHVFSSRAHELRINSLFCQGYYAEHVLVGRNVGSVLREPQA